VWLERAALDGHLHRSVSFGAQRLHQCLTEPDTAIIILGCSVDATCDLCRGRPVKLASLHADGSVAIPCTLYVTSARGEDRVPR